MAKPTIKKCEPYVDKRPKPTREMRRFLANYREESNENYRIKQKVLKKRKEILDSIIGIGRALQIAKDELERLENKVDEDRNETQSFEKEFGIPFNSINFY